MSANMSSLDSMQAKTMVPVQAEWEVNINDASEVRHWMQHWNVTEAELRRAVAEVGTDVAELRIALGK